MATVGEKDRKKELERERGGQTEGGRGFHFAETTWKFTQNFLIVFTAKQTAYFVQLHSIKIHIAIEEAFWKKGQKQ